MKKNAILSLVAGAVLFVWGFVSWAVLPWHMTVANQFTDEAAVSRVLAENAPRAGVYYLPFSFEQQASGRVGAFANILPNGMPSDMGRQMATAYVTQVVSAFLVLALASMGAARGFGPRVGFFALAGLAIGFVSHAPYWVWFGFPASYVGVTILDTIIGWVLAGLAVGRFVSTRSND
ncbi:MAG: hypothetical protein DWQ08_01600 [Proteobacteria bacterium]|nr:MAG: hypothetical protein DWQ08_01600 [Pseudomonadota bacterium]